MASARPRFRRGNLLGGEEIEEYFAIEGQKLNGVSKPTGEELSITAEDLDSAREKSGRWLGPLLFDRCLIRFSGGQLQTDTLSNLNTAMQKRKMARTAGDELKQASVLYFDGCVVVIEKAPRSRKAPELEDVYKLGTFKARNTVFILEDEVVFVRACAIEDNRAFSEIGPPGPTSLKGWLKSAKGFVEIQEIPQVSGICAVAGLHKSAGALALWRGWYETWHGIETNLNRPTTAETAMISVVAQQQTVFKDIVPDYPFKLQYAEGT